MVFLVLNAWFPIILAYKHQLSQNVIVNTINFLRIIEPFFAQLAILKVKI